MQTVEEARQFLRQKYKNREDAKCPCCGGKIIVRLESLSKGLVDTLIKFWNKCISKNTDNLHLQKELNFTKNQYNNFQKLRYFKLVEKTDISGVWRLKEKARDFILGDNYILQKALVFRNKTVELYGKKIFIDDFKKYITDEYWNKIEFYRGN